MPSTPAASASPARPLRKGERSRLAILEAALRVIAREGVEAVTHRSVAREAGISHGSTTYHFASRDEIVLEAFRHYIDSVDRDIAAALAGEGGEGAADLVDVLVAFARREFEDRERVAAEYELTIYAARSPGLNAAYRAWRGDLLQQLERALVQVEVAEPAETAPILFAVMSSFELERLNAPELDFDVLRSRIERVLAAR